MSVWSDALEEAYASAPADEYVIATLELLHPVFVDEGGDPDSIRVALDDRPWDLTYEAGAPLFAGETRTFEPLAMEFTLPEQGEGGLGTLKLAIDNVPRSILPKIQAAARIRASATVIYREWIATRDLSTGAYSVSGPPDMIIDQLTMKIVTASRLRLEGTATFVDLLNRGFPRRKFTQAAFPGLFG